MKVLHIVPTYRPAYSIGGPIWSVHALNKWLVKKGVDVTVYTTDIAVEERVLLNQEVDIDGVKVWYFPASFPRIWEYWRVGFVPALFPRRWEYSCGMHRALAKNVKHFDLVHITSVFLAASTLGAHYAKKFNKPYIISPRGSIMEPFEKKRRLAKLWYTQFIEQNKLKDADAVHFTVEHEKSEYERYGFPTKQALIIPNGLETDELDVRVKQGFFRRKFEIPEDKKIVLFLGRLSWKKGLDTLIPAFSRVIEQEPNAILVLAGGDDAKGYRKEVKKLITNSRLRMGENVMLTGMVLGEDKVAAYRGASVFVLSSHSENFGMSVVEAMYSGLPVVVTPQVGIAPHIKQAGAGFVVNKNEEEVARAIIRVLKKPEEAQHMGMQGKSLVKEKFSMESTTNHFFEAYRDIINKHHG